MLPSTEKNGSPKIRIAEGQKTFAHENSGIICFDHRISVRARRTWVKIESKESAKPTIHIGRNIELCTGKFSIVACFTNVRVFGVKACA